MSANANARLSSGTLVPLMLASLPAATTESDSPSLHSPWDAVALLSHCCLLSVDFRLVGLGEDHRIEASSDAVQTKPLPAEWNDSRSSDFAFRYKHPQSSLEYLLKVSKLGGKAVVSGLGIGDDRVRSFDVPVKDYLSESSFPYKLQASASDDESKQSLASLFISEGRLADFSALFKLKIIQALVPGLHKPGYEESAAQSTANNSNSTDRDERNSNHHPPPANPLPPLAQPRPYNDPLADQPRRPIPLPEPIPGFEDEHQMLRPRGPGAFGGPGMPMSGDQDLYPPGMGPNDPLRIGPGRAPRGGGMHPTPDDPMFGGLGGAEGGYDNQVPPGARYDPIGPHDGPPNLSGRRRFPGGPGGGFGGTGGPPNPFGGFGNGDFI